MFTQVREGFMEHVRVLVVEDDWWISEMLRGLLEDSGITADAAYSGKKALELIEHNPYSAIILDLGLPDIPGLEVLGVLHHRGVATDRVMVFTGYYDEKIRREAEHLGVVDFIQKPLRHPEHIGERVRATANRACSLAAELPRNVGRYENAEPYVVAM